MAFTIADVFLVSLKEKFIHHETFIKSKFNFGFFFPQRAR